MPPPQIRNRGIGERGSLGKALRDRRLKVVKVPTVQGRCLMRLDAEENLPRVIPEIRLEVMDLRAAPPQFRLAIAVDVEHCWFAVVQKGCSYCRDAYILRRRSRLEPKQCSAQGRSIAQVAKQPADG